MIMENKITDIRAPLKTTFPEQIFSLIQKTAITDNFLRRFYQCFHSVFHRFCSVQRF